jgi:hypothetical protein
MALTSFPSEDIEVLDTKAVAALPDDVLVEMECMAVKKISD